MDHRGIHQNILMLHRQIKASLRHIQSVHIERSVLVNFNILFDMPIPFDDMRTPVNTFYSLSDLATQ
eukprot:scaffold41738_cov48-Prasinocladus_malaysianus.AAC.1